jgi:hypothetical protein
MLPAGAVSATTGGGAGSTVTVLMHLRHDSPCSRRVAVKVTCCTPPGTEYDAA